MEYHEVNIPIPNNPPIKGLDIPIDNSSEKFNEYTLNDGTILRVKLVISGVIRAKTNGTQKGIQYTPS